MRRNPALPAGVLLAAAVLTGCTGTHNDTQAAKPATSPPATYGDPGVDSQAPGDVKIKACHPGGPDGQSVWADLLVTNTATSPAVYDVQVEVVQAATNTRLAMATGKIDVPLAPAESAKLEAWTGTDGKTGKVVCRLTYANRSLR